MSDTNPILAKLKKLATSQLIIPIIAGLLWTEKGWKKKIFLFSYQKY